MTKTARVEVNIKGKDRRYRVIIGQGLAGEWRRLMADGQWSRVVIVTDKTVARLYGSAWRSWAGKAPVIAVAAGEKSKSWATLGSLLQKMAGAGLDRRSLVVNCGGGVVSDLGGLAASLYMRGVPYVNAPTTLEAMVDAAVGGKTAVNLGGLKNYVGVVAQPLAVVVDVDCLRTLQPRDVRAGFAEALKHGLIADRSYWQRLISKRPEELGIGEWVELIERSVAIKAEIVAADEREAGERKRLNFGHTVGHAIEELLLETEKPWRHGEAVAVGMVAAAKLSQMTGELSQAEYKEIKQGIARAGLPVSLDWPLRAAAIYEKIKGDKKTVGGQSNWTLLCGIGKSRVEVRVEETAVRAVLKLIGAV